MSRGAGSGKEQTARKLAQREWAHLDPQYSRVMYGTWPPPAVGTPIRTATTTPPAALTPPAVRRRNQRATDDAAYREALGVAPGAALPSKVGQADSAGGARGGKGAAQKGKGARK